jgi:4-hydroxy-3-methylbut-2-enyl diphosphate reductase
MVIVGGKNSNNTRKLVERCRRRNVPAIHIQDPGELSSWDFYDIDHVGLAAGTSTLPETVTAVRRELEQIASQQGARSCRN